MKRALNRGVQAELELLERQHILHADQRARIAERYPSERWDVLVLVRWLTLLGAVSAGVGALLLARELMTLQRLGEFTLLLGCAGFAWLGRFLERQRAMPKTGAALGLLSGFCLQGLSTLLAIDFSSGSDNWPALVGVQAALLAGLAYALPNRLVLIHAGVCFFVFFGAETGYASGWGAYWIGMTYPVRFLAAGAGSCLVAWLHWRAFFGAYQAFGRVYAHFGLLVIQLALWFLAVFGYYEEEIRWADVQGERLLFSALWAAVSVACVWLAGVSGQRLLRGYGLTFLILNLYTFYFQFIAFHTAALWWLHLLLAGGSLVALGMALERRRRERRS